MLVLGIETSCDETAAAVALDGSKILSDIVVSQIDAHKEFGGVVPELASRKHVEAISIVIEQALDAAGLEPEDIEGIGVTRGPGLIGSLIVGIAAAKGMAIALNRPLCGVHHVHGHLFAAFLGYNPLPAASSLPERLATARRALGLSQRKMAEKLGIDPATLMGWEAGRHQPTGKSLDVIGRVLGSP